MHNVQLLNMKKTFLVTGASDFLEVFGRLSYLKKMLFYLIEKNQLRYKKKNQKDDYREHQ